MAKKKPVAKKKKSTVKKTARKKTPQPRKPPRPAEKTVSLGRPKVTGEELLYMLFKDDYHARQIFEFLRVETVKELEQHSAHDIIKRLSAPIEQTVQRIRRTLAERNRCLAGDEQYALEYKSQEG